MTDDERRARDAESTDRAPDRPAAEPLRTCPNCGAPLLERKCKLICPNAQCGYYMSCSDFY